MRGAVVNKNCLWQKIAVSLLAFPLVGGLRIALDVAGATNPEIKTISPALVGLAVIIIYRWIWSQCADAGGTDDKPRS